MLCRLSQNNPYTTCKPVFVSVFAFVCPCPLAGKICTGYLDTKGWPPSNIQNTNVHKTQRITTVPTACTVVILLPFTSFQCIRQSPSVRSHLVAIFAPASPCYPGHGDCASIYQRVAFIFLPCYWKCFPPVSRQSFVSGQRSRGGHPGSPGQRMGAYWGRPGQDVCKGLGQGAFCVPHAVSARTT